MDQMFLAEEGTVVTKEMANTIQNSDVPYVWILGEEDRRIKVLYRKYEKRNYHRDEWNINC